MPGRTLRVSTIPTIVAIVLSVGMGTAVQAGEGRHRLKQTPDGNIVLDDVLYHSWADYTASDFFRINGKRCGTVPSHQQGPGLRGGGVGDCTYTFTNPDPIYDPSVVKYRIPVVVHVIRHDNGVTGHVSESTIHSQIDILNQDFLALVGSNGQNGTDIQIEFTLATTDPLGAPTNGITYTDNTTWFDDIGPYWNTLAWDTNLYLNVYTNNAGGDLGYVPDLPQGGIVGWNGDRIVILWAAFGPDAPVGPPFNQGRSLTHEVGHYLGLDHTFASGCGNPFSCYTSGDLICDTNPQALPTSGCSDAHSCGGPDPFHNYMDYSNDLCLEEFTPEQARRMRCSLEHYRPILFDIVNPTGDCNGDGQVQPGDVSCFVAVLLGLDGDPNHATASDINADGETNALDIQPFVNLLLSP